MLAQLVLVNAPTGMAKWTLMEVNILATKSFVTSMYCCSVFLYVIPFYTVAAHKFLCMQVDTKMNT